MKFLSFFLLLILSLDTFSIPCTQIPTTVPEESSVKSLHDPCASGNSNPNPPDSHFERFIVIGERIAEGEGPPIINVATGGAPLGGFPGGTSSGNGEPGPNGGNTAKKRSCVLFAGAPSGIGVVAKSCKGFTDPNNKAFKVMLEDFKDEVSSQAQDHVRALVKKAMPALPERVLEGITIETQDLVTGAMLDAQIDAILNDTLSEMRAYFNEFDIEPLDGDDSFADLENQIVAHSLRSLNQREAPRIDLRDYEAPITRNFRASGGAFGKKIQNLTDRLDTSSPSEENRVRAKRLAYVAADVADQENYLGHRENADLALEVATELTDFALSVTPIVSVAKDAYELFYGVNEITGEDLTRTDRAFAALGLLTLGSSNLLKGGGKLLKKIGSEVAKRFPGVFKKGASAAIDMGQAIYDSARKSGLFLGNKYKNLKANSSYETVKELFRELDGFVSLDKKKKLVKSFRLKGLRHQILDRDLKVYRWHNNNPDARKLGRFVSTDKILDPERARKLLALPDSNKMLYLNEYLIKKALRFSKDQLLL